MLTPRQIALLQSQFASLAPEAEGFAASFYSRLFRLAPALRPLFPDDLKSQQKKLLATLSLVVASLQRPEVVHTAARALGGRHVAYGASEEQFSTVGEALLGALQDALGDAFDDASRSAWSLAYTLVAEAMSEGMLLARNAALAGSDRSSLAVPA